MRVPLMFQRLVLVLVLLAAATAGSADTFDQRGRFDMRSVELRATDQVYRIDAIARLDLSASARDALESGVALIIALEVEILRERSWWFDDELAAVSRRTRLERHELSGQYVVTNLNTDERRSFYRIGAALDAIGRGLDFPVIDRVLVEDPASHYGRVRMRLERESLPWALRPLAMINGEWKLQTDWLEWSFD